MNAPYDGDRGHGRGEDPAGRVPHAPHDPYAPEPHQQDPYLGDPRQISYSRLPYLQDPYAHDPYGGGTYDTGTFEAYPYPTQDPYAHDPLTDARYDRAAHPPPPAGPPAQGQLYGQPAPGQHAPDPQVWAPTPAPQPEGPSQYLPYGDDPAHTQYVGVDDLVTHAADDRPQPDAFAHLYRDQQPYGQQTTMEPAHTMESAQQQTQPYPQVQQHQQAYPPVPPPMGGPMPPPAAEPEPLEETEAPAPATARKRGKAASVLQSSALMAAGTLVSRLTGFIRQIVIVAALGGAMLGDAYGVAYQLPAMVYFLTVGGGLNSVFVPQLVRAMKEDDDGGVAFANRLLTLAMVILGALVAVSMFAAPWLIQLLSPEIASKPAGNEVAVTFARYCLPTLFFMGVHVVVGQILNARGRFGAMMWTPVLNNVVVIASFSLFIWVFGTHAESNMTETTITAEGIRLLGMGTLLGLTVQALAMFPYLRATGFRYRPRFDWRGKGLGKSARLAKWTVLFVLANQVGLVVVTRLSTAAGAESGVKGAGFVGYTSAQLIWGMPQAIITVSVMAALLPRLSRAAHDGDAGAVRDDISQGLRTSAVAIVPVAFAFLALGVPISTLLFGASGTNQAVTMGYILMAFSLGLIPFSVQYVVLRGFYAYEDTRTPFYNTVIVAAVNAVASALCYVLLPAQWAVAGMAASYGLAYATGVGVAWKRLRTRLGGDLDGRHVVRTYTRLAGASIPAALLGGAAAYAVMNVLGKGIAGSLAALTAGGITLIVIFYLAAKRMRIAELNAMVGMVRGRLGR
ncbi:murein biosynthesis integral membrane protein MurJ [Streptomyces sp. LX-29]|uniref:murein biosynthesis integral membrane protein MurJ n=1 Tax=Streptomyces sp. LX-29 TaxID=2900152 RepID=UPI00240E66CB|nr:murein biosynthesis integral membrane protein MurJ [Streptomyces sp. LX-29]WFB08459.1 murein biosynthesis integral membrane protein MurJ [Streptomyces sp. LX-29]